ncbi:MAG TPA: tripartite tricarboxylate transporter substrate binding protein [Burkholderiaceae bacterium]|nr:tripartite tricarboxylate transporter substrate binding protein [Burkholderiaceae bacterium]
MRHFSPGRRKINGRLLGSAAALGLFPFLSKAQQEKPLQLLVGYPPGGSTDVFARLLAAPLQEVLQRNVVVRNLPGASGQLAASALVREGADGSVVLAINQPDLSLIVARGQANLKSSDFRVAMVDVVEPRVFLVRRGEAIHSFKEFVEAARQKPGQLSVSVTGGSAQEVMIRWLAEQLKLDLIVVNYKGGSEAVQALLAGDVTANLGDDFVRANFNQQLRALFIGSDQQSPRWPEAPVLSSVLSFYGVDLPSPTFLSRYGVYAVSSRFTQENPAAYKKLQQALLEARLKPAFQRYIEKNNLADLSIGQPGERFDSTFEADMKEIASKRQLFLNK